MFQRSKYSTPRHAASLAGIVCLATFSNVAFCDEFANLEVAISKFNETQVRDYHPVFDFDSDGCYPATPFNKNDNLNQNPGLNAAGHTVEGQCRDNGWWNFANTIHRQLCAERDEAQGRVRRCAHFYELYFEKDQAVWGSFAGGHRHDVETVIVWTGRINYRDGGSQQFASHISASAHGNYDTRRIADTIHNLGHAYIVYHKDGAGTHAFRFASQGDRDHVEFLGNQGDFLAPNIVSHYRTYKAWNNDEWDRYWQNVQYRDRLRDSNFGSASFKTRNDDVILSEANKNVPTGDSFWSGFSFTWDDVWWTRDQELWSNYPSVRTSLPE
ncbi:MAG: NPP1 family protein [Steroidobacteraceae bacterium]